jgi:hypothetical protein
MWVLIEILMWKYVNLYFLSLMCHVSCPFYPWLDLLTNLQNTDHEISNYAVLFCLPFFGLYSGQAGSIFPRWLQLEKVKLDMWIYVFYRIPIDNNYSDIYFKFFKISAKNAALPADMPVRTSIFLCTFFWNIYIFLLIE